MSSRFVLLMLAALGSPLVMAFAPEAGAAIEPEAAPESVPSADIEQKPRGFRPVPREQRAHVAFDSPNGMIFFKVKVNGREVDAMLDTGASRSYLDIGFARSEGLHIDDKQSKVRTAKGELPLWPVSGVTVLIPGQFEVDFPSLGGIDMAAVAPTTGRNLKFVLGMDFLRNLALIVDPGKSRFSFAPTGQFKPSDSVRIDLLEGKPRFEVQVGNEKAVVLIDTGSNGHLKLPPEIWTRVIPADTPTGTAISAGAEGKPHAQETVVLRDVQFGILHLNDVRTAKTASSTPGIGAVGMGILGKFRFALDIRAGAFWLAPLPPPSPAN